MKVDAYTSPLLYLLRLMKLRQTGREMQNAKGNQTTIQFSQLPQMKGKQPHNYKKNLIHYTTSLLAPFTYKLIKASGRSRTSERISDFTKCASSQDQKRLEPVIVVISKAMGHTMHASRSFIVLITSHH